VTVNLPVTPRRIVIVLVLLLAAFAGRAIWRRQAVDPALVATVHRGTLTAQLTTSGTLRPIQSLTYRSPIVGREVEIVELAPEGIRVKEGDLLVRLDASEIENDLDRQRQELRQLQMDLQVAHSERQDAEATVKMVAEGEGALTVEEARTRLQLAQKKTERLRQEFEQLKPLMEKGFITRDELARTSNELEQAEEELALARKRADVVVQLTHPREKQRAALQLAQKQAQLEHLVGRVQEAELRLEQMNALVQNATIYARRPGLVVYEEFMNASPRRKVRVGDRVSPSQGLVTIPEVNRMMVETSVGEAEVHRVRQGQPAVVRLEAFPTLRLTGTVVRVGTLASASADRPLDDKRFDLIIELDATDAELRPEMTARADIVVGTRENVLLVPVTAVFEQQGTFVAHVTGAMGVETRPVRLGESNEQFVEIVSGLAEADRVMLTEPAAPGAPPGGANARAPEVRRERVNALQPR
jgi:multidrug efflux pump subunit AcrA (membrane-fusion protein)